jgi:hypothetical protein
MGLTKPRAAQIFNLDYKQATRVATATNITLAGGAPSQVDGVNLSVNDRVLVTGQNTASQNGLYDVATVGSGANGTWVRTGDGNETGEIEAGMIVMVTEGLVYADTQWKLITDNPIYIGTTPLIFVFNSLNVYFTSINAGGNVLTASGNASVVNFAAGSGMSIVGNNVSNTITFISTGSGSGTSISNGTSNVTVVSSGSNVTVGVGGTGNVAVFSTSGLDVTGRVSATGNITGSYIVGNGSQLTGLPASYSNANVTTLLSAFGSNTISTTGNITAGYVIGNGSALSSLTGANITGAVANATYAVSANNSTYSGTVTTNAQPNITSVGTLSSVSVTGTATAASTVGGVITGSSASVTGNVTGANITTDNLVGNNVSISAAGAITLAPTANVSLNSRWIINLADPQSAQDAATKAYVDAITANVHYHAPANAATVTALASTYSGATIVYNNGASGIGANLVMTGNTFTNIDGVNIAVANNRILVKNEANATWNGVYTYSNSTVITRTAAENTPKELQGGDVFFVLDGTVNDNTQWIQTEVVVAIGVSNISFTQIGGAVTYTAGPGLSLTGTQFNACVDGVTTQVNGSNQISVKAGAQLTTPNIGEATGTSLSVTGTVTSSSLVGGIISTTGNITGNYILGNGSQLTGLPATYSNANVTSLLAAFGSNTISTSGNVTAGNVTGNYILGNGSQLTGLPATYSNANVTSLLAAFGSNTISTSGNVTAGNVTGGNIIVSGTITDTTGNLDLQTTATNGNINLITNGTGVVQTTANINAANVSVTGNIYTGNILTNGYYYANGVAFSGGGGTPGGANTQIQFNDASSFGGSAGLTFNKTTNALATTGTVSATANITGGNVLTGGLISATANITGNYLIGNVVAGTGSGGNITGANLITAVTVSASGNISDGIGFLRNIPINSQTANYTLTVNDTGKFISSNTTVNIPPSIFSAGNVMTVYNNSAVSITVVAITGVTLQLAGSATTGNRTVAQRGVGTVLCVAANTFVMYGTGVT